MYRIRLLLALSLFTLNTEVNAQCLVTSTPTQDCYYGDAIDAFSLGGVPSTGNFGCGNSITGYVSYSTPVRNLNIGQTYPFTATTGTSGYYQYYEALAIWIDLNNNGQYENSEMLARSPSGYSHSGNITIPTTATAANNVRMRVRCAYSGSSGTHVFAASGADACTNNLGSGYGETEDYFVNLISACSIPAPTASTTTPNVCSGQTATLTANGAPSTTIKWYTAATGGTAIATGSPFTTPAITANTTYYAAASDATCEGPRTAVALTVVTAPTITTQPTDKTVCNTANTTFTVAATGATTYKWQVDPGTGFVDVTNVAPYSGITTATLTLTNPPASFNNYKYRAVVGNANNCTVNSNAVTLTVNAAPSITTQPANASVCPGANATFTAAASGTGVTGKWQVNTGSGFSDVPNAAPYSGVTTPTLTITNATAGMNGYQYQYVASGTCPPTATSTPATLLLSANTTINTQPPVITYACPGSNTNISVAATGGGLSYQWQVNNGSGYVNVNNVPPYSGANTSTLTISNVPLSLSNYKYRVAVGSSCASALISDETTIELTSAPIIMSQPKSEDTACIGESHSMAITTSGANTSYQWQVNTGGGFVNIADNATYTGSQTATLNILNTTSAMSGNIYRVNVTGACNPVAQSNPITLRIATPTAITDHGESVVMCEDEDNTFTVTTTGTVSHYQWQVNRGNGYSDIQDGGAYSGTTTRSLVVSPITDSLSNYLYRLVVKGFCNQLISDGKQLGVKAKPRVAASPADTKVFQMENATFNTTASGANVYYTWQSKTPNTEFVYINDNQVYSGTTTSKLTVHNATIAQDGYQFRCVVFDGSDCGFAADTTAVATLNVERSTSVLKANDQKNVISIYPNPVAGSEIIVYIANSNYRNISIRVIDKTGRTLQTENMELKETENKLPINVSRLPVGNYAIQVLNLADGNSQSIMFTKQ
jgi:hypothetical protein